MRDDGWSRFGATHRIPITVRYRVRRERENRRTERTEIFADFNGEVCFEKDPILKYSNCKDFSNIHFTS
jgi:hypothetical protein